MTETTITFRGPGISTTQQLDIEIAIETTVNIDAQTARRRVTGWLVSEVGNMLMGGTPRLVIAQQTVWRVPALLTSSERGVVGEVGTVDVSADSGALLIDTSLPERILENARHFISSPLPAAQ